MTIGMFYARTLQGGTDDYGRLYAPGSPFAHYLPELIRVADTLGYKTVLLCKTESFDAGSTFHYYFEPDHHNSGWYRRVNEPIKVDVIHDKGYFRRPTEVAIINTPQLATLGRDKKRQGELFKDMAPKTISVTSRAQAEQALKMLKTDLKVCKPNSKNGGRGVVIGSDDDILQRVTEGETYVLQEFADSIGGIPGVTGTHHDLRFYMLNDCPALASVRTPAPGRLVSNTSQGGSIKFIDPSHVLDDELYAMINTIDQYCQQFGARYYSIDVLRGPSRWYLLELNDRPGIPAQFESPLVPQFHVDLMNCIAQAAQTSVNQQALAGFTA